MLAGLVFAENSNILACGMRLCRILPLVFLDNQVLAIPIISKTPGLSTASPLFLLHFSFLAFLDGHDLH